MNIRVPTRLERRLRAHASRLGLSLNATATHLLGAHLPDSLEPTMIRWLDAQGPPAPELPEGGELPPLETLHPVPFRLPGAFRPHVRLSSSPMELEFPGLSWTVSRAHGLRVHVLENPGGSEIKIRGPWLRRSGGPAELLEQIHEPLSSGEVHVLRGPVELSSMDKVTLSIEAGRGGPLAPTVSVELLVAVSRDEGLYPILFTQPRLPVPGPRSPLPMSSGVPWPPGHTEVALPLRVPLVDKTRSSLFELRPGDKPISVFSMATPWCIWRLNGLELEVDADPGATAVSAVDLKIGGSPCLLQALEGLSHRSLTRGAEFPLRAYPVVRDPNHAMVELRLDDLEAHSGLDPKRRARVTGYALGTILAVKDHLVGALDAEALAEGEGLEEIK